MATDIINSANLTPQATLQVPTYQPTPVDPSIANSAIASVAGQYDALNKQQEQAQAEQKAQAESQLSLQNALLGKTADTQAFQDQAGVNSETAKLNSYAQTLADLNAQASSLNREAQAIPIANRLQYQQGGIAGTESQVKNANYDQLQQNALKALSIAQQSDIASAALTGSQLKLQAAKDKAQQMVDLKYKPIEDQLAIKKQQYELNKDILGQIDKKRTEALNAAIKKEERDLEEKKNNEKGIADLVTNASAQGAPADLRARAAKAKTPMEAANILGVYAGDYLKNQLLKEQLNTEKAQQSKIYTDIAKTKSEMGDNGVPSGMYLDPKVTENPTFKLAQSLTPVKTAIARYQQAVKDYGSFEMANATGKGEIKQAYGNAIAAWKTMAGLGALSGADFGLAENVIPAPTLFTRNSVIDAQLSGAVDSATSQVNTYANTLKTAYPKSAAGIDSVLNPVKIELPKFNTGNKEWDGWYSSTSNTTSSVLSNPSTQSYGFTDNQTK